MGQFLLCCLSECVHVRACMRACMCVSVCVCMCVIVSRQSQLVPMFCVCFSCSSGWSWGGFDSGSVFALLSECVRVRACMRVCKCMCVYVCDCVKAIPACRHVLCVFFLFLMMG